MMRKYLIAAAVAASAMIATAPAAAQYYPQGQGYGRYNPDGRYGGGHLMERLDRIHHQINRLDRRDVLSERESRYLRHEANDLRHRVARRSWNGLNHRERWNLQQRIDRLERRVFREARDHNNRPGGGWNDGRIDRDGDGRWDRDDRYDYDDRRW
jgi:hypothetical protein